MNILFVHQSFPGQYTHIISTLAEQRCHTLVGLGIFEPSEALPKGINYFRYQLARGNTPGIHDWLLDIDSKLIRGEACANAAHKLKQQGFTPDLICAHPGWGEALFIRDVWGNVPLLCYQEFFYNAIGFDYDFDPELQTVPTWREQARIRFKNANPLMMLESSSWNVTPTKFQQSSFPSEFHSRISVIHDGIDTLRASPDPDIGVLKLSNGVSLSPSDSIVTFVNRRLEPYRGCHTFIRSIPQILSSHPEARIVIVGETQGVSYGSEPSDGTWKDCLLEEIKGQYCPDNVIFTGTLDSSDFYHLLKLSSCHVYLTYPFVLSWSLLEAMSCGLPVVGSNTAPVQEVIHHSETGLLVDFFNPSEVADAVALLLSDRPMAIDMGKKARQHILLNYNLQSCVSRQISLMELVASKAL